MRSQEKEDKKHIKIRFAIAMSNALKDSKLKSYRQLAKEAGMEPSHVQLISAGKLDVTLTTIISIIIALGLSFSEFSSFYDKVTDKELLLFETNFEKKSNKRPFKKIK